ncbi:MAG: P-II family nitrogen regulator [Aquificaceae bacterium]|nr:P-II family nitrogen regulator [Aquificaceae bacterium]
MKMVKAIIRPERLYDLISALEKKDFRGMTVVEVFGRGKEGGLRFGERQYYELAKTLVMIAVNDDRVDELVDTIIKTAGSGLFGDGKVFVCDLEEVWTIRTGKMDERL